MHHFLRPTAALAAAAVTLALGACSADPVAPSAAAAAMPSAAVAGSDTTAAPVLLATTSVSPNGMWNDVKSDLVRGLQIPCSSAGLEIAVFQGTEHLMYRETKTANGHYQLYMQTNGQGVTGTGLVSGDTYHMNGKASSSVDFVPSGLLSFDEKNAFTVTSAGKTGNIVATETLRYTIDTNTGEMKVFLVNFNAVCK